MSPSVRAQATDRGEVLTLASQVLSLGRAPERVGSPVQLTGTVTYVDPAWGIHFLQDASGGVYLDQVDQGSPRRALAVGDSVRLRGTVDRGGFAPVVVTTGVDFLGQAPLPAPRLTTPDRLVTGADDSQWVELRGVVVEEARAEFSHLTLMLATPTLRLRAFVPGVDALPVQPLVDAEVSITGVGASDYTASGQLKGVKLFVPSMAMVRVVRAAPVVPEGVLRLKVNEVLRYSPEGRVGHRVFVRGVVTHSSDAASVFIQTSEGAIRAEVKSALPAVGEEVDLLGFPGTEDGVPYLRAAEVRSVGPGAGIAPLIVDPATLEQSAEKLDQRLGEIRGVVMERSQSRNRLRLLIAAGEQVIEARLLQAGLGDAADDLRLGATVRLRGVLQFLPVHLGAPPRIRLLMRTVEDAVVVRAPPWLNGTRAAWLSASGLIGFMGWVVLWERRKLRMRREYELLFEQASDVVFRLNLDGSFLALNAAGRRLFGRSAEDNPPIQMRDLLTPEEWDRFLQAIANLGPSEVLGTMDMSWKVRGSEVRRMEVSLRRVLNGALPTAVEGIARDVTDRRRAEEALRSVVSATAAVSGTAFFEDLVKTLARTLGVRCAMAAERVVGPNGDAIRALNVWLDNRMVPNIQYDLASTPCDTVIKTGFCAYSSGVRDLFPRVQILQELNAEAYFAARIVGAEGRVIGVLAVVHDQPYAELDLVRAILAICAARAGSELERLRALEARDQSEARLRMAVHASNLGFYDWDVRVNTIYFSPEWKAQLGYADTEFASTFDGFVERLHPQDRTAVIDAMRGFLTSGERCLELSYRLRRKDGSYRVIAARAEAERDADQVATRVLGTHFDLTDVRAVEHALHATEARFHAFVDQSLLFAWIKDLDGRYVYVNSPMGDYFRRPIEQWIGKTDSDLWPAAVSTTLRENDLRVLRTGRPERLEENVPDPEGRVRAFLAIKFPLQVQGRVQGVGGMCIDITQQKAAEKERAQLETSFRETQRLESLGVLAGGMAHDFNNLLTGILGNANLCRSELPEASPALEYVGHVEESALAAASLCRQLLAYSGRGRFVIQKLSLNHAIRETTQLLDHSIHRNATLRYELGELSPTIEADPSQLRQVIMNLVINASDALMGNPGTITVSTGAIDLEPALLAQCQLRSEGMPQPCVFLRIADTGVGMAAQTIARIFEPFYTTKSTGRGLGLAAVQGIVNKHNGALHVDSRPDQGTTFTVYFPEAEADAPPIPSTPVRPSPARARGRVLVVDDEAVVRQTAARALELAGLSVARAMDGRLAVEMLRSEPDGFDLVLLDFTMPQMTGAETFAEMQRIHPGLPVLIMSGFTAEEMNEAFPLQQPAGFLEKPFKADDLQRRVVELLERQPPTPSLG